MLITNGFITGNMCTHGFGAQTAHIEHTDLAFSINSGSIGFTLAELDSGLDEVSLNFTLTQGQIGFTFANPYGTTNEGVDIFCTISLKYPED